MDYAITEDQIKKLRKICKKIIRQSPEHERNIIKYYSIMLEEARDEFNEDNHITVCNFLEECFINSLKQYKTCFKCIYYKEFYCHFNEYDTRKLPPWMETKHYITNGDEQGKNCVAFINKDPI